MPTTKKTGFFRKLLFKSLNLLPSPIAKAIAKSTSIINTFGKLNFFNFEDAEDFLKAGTGKIWASFRSCKIISDVFTATDLDIVDSKDRKTSESKNAAILQKLILNPNDHFTFSEMMYLWVFHIKLTGHAFWYVNKTGNRPDEIWPLNPKRVSLHMNTNGIVGYSYHVNGQAIPFDKDEIIFWRYPHPDDDILGMGEIEGGKELFDNFSAQQKFQSKFLEGGGSYSTILVHKEPIEDETSFRELKTKWNKEYAGSENAGKTAWLSGEWDSIQIGMTIKDMMHLESMEVSVAHIFAMHGVPLSVAMVKSGDNLSTVKEEDIQFRKYTVAPLMQKFCERFNRECIQVLDPSLLFVYNLGGIANIREIVGDFKELFAMAGVTPNDMRQKAGLGRIDGNPMLDKYYIGNHLVPVDALDIESMGENGDGATFEDNNAKPEDELGNRQNTIANASMAIVHSAKKNGSDLGGTQMVRFIH